MLFVMAVAVSAVFAPVAQRGDFTLRGIVTTDSGVPVRDAQVLLFRGSSAAAATMSARSAADGTFSFDKVAGGIAVVRVRMIGFVASSVTFRVDTIPASRPLRIVLSQSVTVLDPVEVEEQEGWWLRGFRDRQRARSNGYFIDRDRIEKERPIYTSDLMRTLPGMRITAGARIGNQVRIRGCKPTIWLDGVEAQGAELDEVTHPGDIAGMEVYPSWAGVPIQFNDRQGRNCGAIIVWTRIR